MHPLCSSVGPYHNFSYANSPNIAMWSLVKLEVHPPKRCYLKAFSTRADPTKLYLTQATAAQAQRYGHTAL